MFRLVFTTLILVFNAIQFSHAEGLTHSLSGIDIYAKPKPPNQIETDEITFNASVIRRQDFAHKSTNLAELIQQQTGSWVRSTGGSGSFSQVSLRGSAPHQTVVYLDGVRLNSANGASVDLSQIPLDNIEKITLYKGSAPLQFGQIFQGGVIHIETRQYSQAPLTQLNTEVASDGFYKLGLFHSNQWKKGHYLLNLSRQQAKNNFRFTHDNGTPLNPYDDRKERRHNAQTQLDNLLIKADYQQNASQTLSAQFSWSEGQQHLPNRQNSINNQAQFSRLNQQLQLSFHQQQLGASKWDSSSELILTTTEEHYLDPKAFIGLGKQDNRYLTDSLQVRQYFSSPFDLGELYVQAKFNIELQQESYQSIHQTFNTSVLVSDDNQQHQRQTLNLGLELPSHYQKLTFVPTLRWQQLTDQADSHTSHNLSTRDQDFTGNLGFNYQLSSQLNIKANIAKAVRQPSFYEKYSDRGYVLGNPNLKKETAFNRDLGFEWRLGHHQAWWQQFNLSSSLFLNDVKDIIVMTYDARGIGRATNLESARLLGLELSSQLKTRQQTELSLNYTQTHSLTQDNYSAFDQKKLANIPPKKLSINLSQGLKKWRGYYEYLYAEGSFYDRANLLPIANTHLHNLGISYQQRRWLASFEVKNLLDTNHQDFNGYPKPGKSFHLKLQYQP